MALVKYVSKMEVHLKADGGTLSYEGDIFRVRISHSSGDQPVETFGGNRGRGGISGFTDGSGRAEITFDKAIPRAGRTFDMLGTMYSHKDVTLYGQVGNERRKYEGRIMSVDEDYGLNNPSAENTKIVCGEPETVS